jgi:23S rRNA (cytidine1920-2'-O)/16S rRNA (cytidine1409-2'-O)-methyltransferase
VARTRLDVALVQRGLFDTRARAHAAVMAGEVLVDGEPAVKPGHSVDLEAEIDVVAGPRFVSRGGEKLQNALDRLGVDVGGCSALDIGSSTGGFTDCLLQNGATRVIALDVGRGQLDWSLRNDSRVHVLERTNARSIGPDALPWVPDLVTVDVAFISVTTIWPAVRACLADGWRALVMVKPQFELGPERVGKGGVVRDPADRLAAVRSVAAVLGADQARIVGACDSGLAGPKGNRETFVRVDAPGSCGEEADVEQMLQTAIDEAA